MWNEEFFHSFPQGQGDDSPLLHCVALNESAEAGKQQREIFTKPKWKIYDFSMFWSRITASHGIAVK